MNTYDLEGAVWRKSSRSNGQSNCVEVANLNGIAIGARDSKRPDRGALVFPLAGWSAFVELVKRDV